LYVSYTNLHLIFESNKLRRTMRLNFWFFSRFWGPRFRRESPVVRRAERPQPAGRRLSRVGRSRLRKAFLRAPTRCPEAGGQGSAGPSAAWMPRKSLVWCSCPLKSLFGGQNRRTPRRALGPYPDL
jgi:hypothetical protein